jgi:hypothetical protein
MQFTLYVQTNRREIDNESNDEGSTRLIRHLEVLSILLGACVYVWLEEDMEVLAIVLSTCRADALSCL